MTATAQTAPDGPTAVETAAALLALDQQLVAADVAAAAVDASGGTIPGFVRALTTPVPGQGAATTRPQVYAALGRVIGQVAIDVSGDDYTVDIDVIQDLTGDLLTAHVAVPVRAAGQVLLAAGNPSAPAVRDLAARIGPDTPVRLADPLAILSALKKVERKATIDAVGAALTASDHDARRAAAPTIALDESSNQGWVRETIDRAIRERASDVHVSLSTNGNLRVAYRIDGDLRAQIAADIDPQRAVNTIVQHADMDIGARNRPQSSSFTHTTPDGRRYNVRAELLPTVTGPDLTLRLLASHGLASLDQMGLLDAYTRRLRDVIARKQGLVLVTGPTGHGKTTTLYGALLDIRDGHRKIVAIEDPVEYKLDGVTQVQVNPRNESSVQWLEAISSALRSDPDVMLIGEIRDQATAKAAVQASQTGHLVLATLHTNNAVAAFSRLAALDVDPVEIAAQTSLVTGQRLVPKLHGCAQRREVDEQDWLRLTASGIDAPTEAFYPAEGGCDGCDGAGTLGRVPLVEMLSPDRPLRAAIAAGHDEGRLNDKLNASNFLSFAQEARRLIDDGLAAPDEVVKCLREETVDITAALATSGEGR